MDELLAQFLLEARELIAAAEADLGSLRHARGDPARIDSLFRAIHTLKGSVAIFDMAPAGVVLHGAEDILGDARAGRRGLDPATLDTLVACVDQLDRWVDQMERDGELSTSAPTDAERLLAELAVGSSGKAKASNGAWADALAREHGQAMIDGGGQLVAFRYQPDSDCFFRGDDPVAILSAVPDLVALSAKPVEPWPAPADLQPFHCNLIFEGLSGAPIDEVRAALRFVGDQATIDIVGEASAGPVAVTVDGGQARTFRVDATILDTLADDVGELMVVSNALAHLGADLEALDSAMAARLAAVRTALDGTLSGLRRTVEKARMAPIGPSLRRLPRLVREAAARLRRDVEFAMTGEGTEIDKGIADALFEPLLHLLRNAIDHGIEPADARTAAGKPARGALTLDVRRTGDHVVIEVADDGAGIDPDRMRQAAVARGLIDGIAADALDDQSAIELVFAAGFSTANAVTEMSGRGVGMDAVRTTIERLGGRTEISSQAGKGTRVRLRLPLSAVTTRILTVRVGEDDYAVPVESIVETARVASERILRVGTGRAVVLRDRTLPFIDLAALLGKKDGRTAADTRLLVTAASGEPVALGVDGFGTQMDVMLRPPAGLLAEARGLAGTTLLGDGRVLIALDLGELIE